MSVTARKRSYGDFEWISITDTSETKDAVRSRERKRERESDVEYQNEIAERQEASAEKKMAEVEIELAGQEAPPEGWARANGRSWYTIMRTRWRNFNIQCRKKEIDSLPWDVYKSLWKAAGCVTPPWGGQDTEAYKLQDKFYSKRFRCLLVRWDETKGHGKGNSGVVLVEGYFRCHQNHNLKPIQYEVLAAWETDGRITDRDGSVADTLE